MKQSTRLSDLGKVLAVGEAATPESLAAAQAIFKKLPLARRAAAREDEHAAHAIASNASHQGGRYSGDTSYVVTWGATPAAKTETSKGAQYSRACTYKKTDAVHTVTVCAETILPLVDRRDLVCASERDGLSLIAFEPATLAATWTSRSGKAIKLTNGWVAWDADATHATCYHSEYSAEHARAGLAKKRAIEKARTAYELARTEARTADKLAHKKQERRATLIARLCGGISATIGDAKKLGYCSPGIAAFQSRHGLGDTVPLPELIKTGNASAVALALKLARTVSRQAPAALSPTA